MLALIIIAIAFIWLGYETNWLTIRLPYGSLPVIPEPERMSWDDIKLKYKPLEFSPGVEAPLCGWDWLENTMHVIPESKVYMIHGGVRYSMTIKDPTVIKTVVTAMKTPKPKKVTNRMKRNKLGGYVGALPSKS